MNFLRDILLCLYGIAVHDATVAPVGERAAPVLGLIVFGLAVAACDVMSKLKRDAEREV